MKFKNKAEREKFLENHKAWELWKEIPELELKFYRKVLPNGTMIIATEYALFVFADWGPSGCKYKKSRGVKYHLLLSDNEKYKVEHVEYAFRVYNPTGDSKSAIVEYLTKTKPEV